MPKRKLLVILSVLLLSSCVQEKKPEEENYLQKEGFSSAFAYHLVDGGDGIIPDLEDKVPLSSDDKVVIDGFYPSKANKKYFADGVLSIPSEVRSDRGKGYEVIGLGKRAFYDIPDLHEVILPPGLRFIEEECFAEDKNLQRLELSSDSQLSALGNDAFYHTAFEDKEVTEPIYLGKALYRLPSSFTGNYSVKEGTLALAYKALKGSLLSSLSLPESLIYGGKECLGEMKNLTSLNGKNCSFAENALKGTGLQELTYKGDIPAEDLGLSSLTEAGITSKKPVPGVLRNQKNLKTADLKGVQFLYPGSFEGDEKIETILNSSSLQFSGDSFLLTSTPWGRKQRGEVYLGTSFLGDKDQKESVVLKENTTGITGDSLKNRKIVNLPSDLVGVGKEALSGTDIVSFKEPSLIYLGEHALKDARALREIEVNAEAEIEKEPFLHADKVSSLNVPCSSSFTGLFGEETSRLSLKSLTLSGKGKVLSFAYKDCLNLQELHLSSSITSFEEEAFRSCSALKELNLPASLEYLKVRSLAYCSSLKTIKYTSSSLKTVESFAFQGDKDLQTLGNEEGKIIFPSSLRSLGGCPFASCTEVKEVTFILPSSYRKDGLTLDKQDYLVYSPDWNLKPKENERIPGKIIFE